jgi:hypothetical protein
MKELFEDLIEKINDRTALVVDYIEMDYFCGVEIFRDLDDKLTGRFVARLGFNNKGYLDAVIWSHGDMYFESYNLYESGDPEFIMIDILKRKILNSGELNNWILCESLGHSGSIP